MKSINICQTEVGRGLRPFVIAEVGQAHEGSLGLAHCYIDSAVKAGVDAVKFQTHIAKAESTLDEPFRVAFSRQDKTRFDYWKRMEFSPEQWAGLSAHAREKNLVFLSSAFSFDAVNLLANLDMPAWKIGSGEFWSEELLQAMLDTGKPLIISTGMSAWSEILAISEKLEAVSYPYAFLQCTSRYPTQYEQVGLNVITEMQNRFDCPIGLSDHSGTIFPALAAMSRGASIVEVHLTLSREMFGPDVSSSLSIDELALLVEARDAFYLMDSHPVDKNAMAQELTSTRDLFSKSIALAREVAVGSILNKSDLCAKKPGTGISLSDIDKVVGSRLVNDVSTDRLLKWEDIK